MTYCFTLTSLYTHVTYFEVLSLLITLSLKPLQWREAIGGEQIEKYSDVDNYITNSSCSDVLPILFHTLLNTVSIIIKFALLMSLLQNLTWTSAMSQS